MISAIDLAIALDRANQTDTLVPTEAMDLLPEWRSGIKYLGRCSWCGEASEYEYGTVAICRCGRIPNAVDMTILLDFFRYMAPAIARSWRSENAIYGHGGEAALAMTLGVDLRLWAPTVLTSFTPNKGSDIKLNWIPFAIRPPKLSEDQLGIECRSVSNGIIKCDFQANYWHVGCHITNLLIDESNPEYCKPTEWRFPYGDGAWCYFVGYLPPKHPRRCSNWRDLVRWSGGLPWLDSLSMLRQNSAANL